MAIAVGDPLANLGQELRRLDYEWLFANFPELTEHVVDAVNRGVTPVEIRRYAVRLNGRMELATRMMNAALYVEATGR